MRRALQSGSSDPIAHRRMDESKSPVSLAALDPSLPASAA